ncbi:hypothetical protein SAMN06295912_104203 [Sphingomonas laterariae]|uniref:Uncharacterized protein n=1 Tax=Edaphosphingomonas laterariae TaxID=861865 RepID=A0A239DP38_9SPHN|nr:hypothetical protein [Sphingomonas laterariae]SNS33939.1 hypothetical protein SAMN06295912_104203 [Sphingomonas laterariae]
MCYARSMTAGELQDRFIATLAREAGGGHRRWRIAVGPVRLYSIDTHPHCNWAVTPSGSAGEIERVERVADVLRQRHPIVTE